MSTSADPSTALHSSQLIAAPLPLYLISILETNILKKILLLKLFWSSLARFQAIRVALPVLKFEKCDSAPRPAASPCFLLPRNGSGGRKAGRKAVQPTAGNSMRMGSLMLLPALPDRGGCETGCKTVSHIISFSTPAKTRKHKLGDTQRKPGIK